MKTKLKLHADFILGEFGSTLVRVNASFGDKSVIKTIDIDDFLELINSTKYKTKEPLPEKVSSGMLPPNTFAYSKTSMGYELGIFVPGSVRLLRVNNEAIEVPVPSAVMVFNQNTILRWRACTCKTRHELNYNTPLYHWPFGHVYQGGNVCIGNVKCSSKNELEIPRIVEDLLLANNSHSNTSSVKLGENIAAIRDKNLKEFPKELLIPCEQNVGTLLKSIR